MTEFGIAPVRRIWDMVPDIPCDGRCADHCTAVPMTGLELAIVRGKMPWYPDLAAIADRLARGEQRCPALSASGRCTVYEVRPLVCRIFGAAESLRCPYGCEPVLSAEQASDIMDAMFDVGGTPA